MSTSKMIKINKICNIEIDYYSEDNKLFVSVTISNHDKKIKFAGNEVKDQIIDMKEQFSYIQDCMKKFFLVEED